MTSARLPNAALGEVIRQARHLLIGFEGPIRSEAAEAPAAPALHIHDVLAACHESGRFAAVISSTPADTVHAYLDAHDLASAITTVTAPSRTDPASLPPEPDLIRQAARSLDTQLPGCVIVTSAPRTVQAALAAGVPAIGYARTRDHAGHLAAAGANVAIYSMADLALTLRAQATDRKS